MYLYVNYFKAKDSQRQNELDTCLLNNIQNRHIIRIFAVTDGVGRGSKVLNNPKVEVILFGARPTYSDFFKIIKLNSPDGVNCIANADVFFNDTLRIIPNFKERECWALTRWDYAGGKLNHINRKDSQDAWIFKGAPKIEAPFHLGVPGCDNRIAWEFSNAGFIMKNPSLTLQMIHLHKSPERPYFNGNKVSIRVPQPYLFVPATKL